MKAPGAGERGDGREQGNSRQDGHFFEEAAKDGKSNV